MREHRAKFNKAGDFIAEKLTTILFSVIVVLDPTINGLYLDLVSIVFQAQK